MAKESSGLQSIGSKSQAQLSEQVRKIGDE